jgi:G:T-mismatch repair DNA endonuclease (very short patch repair protein)
MRTFIINWYGPYTLDEVTYEAESGDGIYLITGKLKYQRNPDILYCGITEGTFYNRFKYHHKKDLVFREQRFWLGKIKYPVNFNRNDLETAEKIIIYVWEPRLNERKKVSPPTQTTLLSFWFKKDHTPRTNQLEIYRDLYDVISWNGENWRTGNLHVWST